VEEKDISFAYFFLRGNNFLFSSKLQKWQTNRQTILIFLSCPEELFSPILSFPVHDVDHQNERHDRGGFSDLIAAPKFSFITVPCFRLRSLTESILQGGILSGHKPLQFTRSFDDALG
jgi:hypothetical protein